MTEIFYQEMSLLENLSNIHKRICHAAMRAGRDPSEVKLLAVTKTIGPDIIKEAIEHGVRLIGENRVQEAKEKIEILKGQISDSVQWHMIGHLQKNKVRAAVGLFDMIQSVDSPELARRMDRIASEMGKLQPVLVQVKLSEEETKHGVETDRVFELLEEVMELENLQLQGLMTIPPFFDDPEETRPYFRRLREIKEEAEARGFSLPELSMGMTGDFEVAIEEGSTMVRIGTAIFGRRHYR